MRKLIKSTRWPWIVGICVGLFVGTTPAWAQSDEPPLPMGLEEDVPPSDEPALPPGLGGDDAAVEDGAPALPQGLSGPEEEPTPVQEAQKSPEDEAVLPEWLDIGGFWEIRGGVRTQRDSDQKDASLGESRLQLDTEAFVAPLTFKLTADLLYDAVLDRHSVNLERGQGFLDLREANVTFTPVSFMDVKIGRQILTWGTGDLLFLNDMFPKDWQAFFIGRDVEYLKAPSDAVKISLFSDLANLDIVFTPRFDPDRFIEGRRISYFDPMSGERVGRGNVIAADIPNEWFRDHEWATRLSKMIDGYELAAYGYWGYWKSPAGFKLPTGQVQFPRLSVYGASARGPVLDGIGNVEVAYYDSREDRNGDDFSIDNSEFRFLAGYERDLSEIASDLTVALQYYLEWKMDHDDYARTLVGLMPPDDEMRHVVTFRVTKLLLNQNLKLSLFAYYSPSDADAYLRPYVEYKIDDHWRAEVGGNVFFGRDDHTFFGQFARNTNVYLGLRYSF